MAGTKLKLSLATRRKVGFLKQSTWRLTVVNKPEKVADRDEELVDEGGWAVEKYEPTYDGDSGALRIEASRYWSASRTCIGNAVWSGSATQFGPVRHAQRR